MVIPRLHSVNTPLIACSCCGEPLPDERRIDIGFDLPDAARTAPQEARHSLGPRALLRVDGVGSFVRCLLPVRLTHETEIVYGLWLEVDDDALRDAHAVWGSDAYAELTLRGKVANVVRPWGDSLMGATVTARVKDPEELPYLIDSDRPSAAGVLADVWDRDQVLSRIPHPLPVAVRTDLGSRWSVERTAGTTARYADGVDHFAEPGRTVAVRLFEDDTPGRTPEDFLAALLEGAPVAAPGRRLTEHAAPGVRYAHWFAPGDHGGGRYEFLGYTVPSAGTAAGVLCSYEAEDDLAWAQRVWRSLSWGGVPEGDHGAGSA